MLSIILIGLFGFLLIGLWVIIRTVLALVAAQKKEAIANPAALIW